MVVLFLNHSIQLDLVFSPFPEVAEAVQDSLESYRNEEEQVKMLKSAMVSSHSVMST